MRRHDVPNVGEVACALLIGAAGIAHPSPGSAQASDSARAPGYDLSGLRAFWATVEILESDRAPTEAEWSRLLEHPGYAQIERQGQRGAAVRRCLPLVFRPSERAGLPGALESDDVRVRRVCEHLERVRDRRAELEAFESTLTSAEELEVAVERVSGLLPEGATEGPLPPVYVILFEQNGFGGASLALDALLLQDMSRELRLGYLAHELHHAFRSRVERFHVDRDDPDYLLVAAISSLAEEGIASLLDKRRYLEPGYAASLEEPWREIVTTFVDHYDRSAEILAEVDRRLRRVADGEASPSEVGTAIKRGLPWGGHPTGMYMALAIEEAFGPARITDLSADPLEFILAYQRAASGDAALYRFSDDAISLVRALRRRHAS